METHKIALITGGSRGIGRSEAIALSKKGIHSVITYKSDKASAELVVQEIEQLGGKAVSMQLDVSEISSFELFVSDLSKVLKQTWGQTQLDILINNAGIGGQTLLGSTTEEQFDDLINVNFKGIYFLTQALLPLIVDRGSIINVSSALARVTAEGSSIYGAMKGALEILTKYWAKELGVRKIKVNTVAPGPTVTDFGGGIIKTDESIREYLIEQTALGEVGDPDHVASVIASLCLDDMQWVTAQRIEASGGFMI
ncbi:SDR family oxidoreductase [Paenibacillus sp. PsM32]|uniref:SDR family NAD(P)-dependent oxidoreductase n=1 Tax=Paenibacillus sp. PsM32 TaxID=3030536 RepID=UPI00263BC06B|nr:SDR family oxidoreductase [Paenibacillus sp. PsM32]MDN4618416.1 SDR family oxidoreductase [Paenibacillus sp. PsM32]